MRRGFAAEKKNTRQNNLRHATNERSYLSSELTVSEKGLKTVPDLPPDKTGAASFATKKIMLI